MSIEEMIRDELEVAVSAVPKWSPAGIEWVEKRGGRRLVVARVGLVLAGAVVFAAVFGVSLLLGPSTDPSQATQPTGQSDTSVVIAGDRIPVGEVVEAFSKGPMYYGAVTAEPTFDASSFGDEIHLEFGTTKVADPDAWEGPTIYIGEYQGESIFLNERLVDGVATKCLWIGPTPQLCGDGGSIPLLAPPRPGPQLGLWLAVPDETSIVVLRQGDDSFGWQSPVSGVVVFPLPSQGKYQLVALDRNETKIGEVGITFSSETKNVPPDPGAATTTTP